MLFSDVTKYPLMSSDRNRIFVSQGWRGWWYNMMYDNNDIWSNVLGMSNEASE
jgi:hypothetical protein